MVFAFTPVLILFALMAPVLLAGLIILLVKGGPAVRWFIGICLLLVVIGFFGLLSVRVSRPVAVHEHMRAQTTECIVSSQGEGWTGPRLQAATLHVASDAAVWQQGLEEELTPDVYSSQKTAAYGLGVQLQETIEALSVWPGQVVIVEHRNGVDIALLEQCRRGLKSILPDLDIAIVEKMPSETPPKEAVWIFIKREDIKGHELQISEIPQGDSFLMSQMIDAGNRKGTLQAVVQTADNKYVRQVEFDYRPWLDDTEAFHSSVDRGHWAVITSSETVVSEEQARNQALQLARQYLVEQMGLQDVRQHDVRDYGFIVDEYSQRFQGLSGSIWRSAILLEISPERLQMLSQDKADIIRQTRKSWAYYLFSLIGMTVLISILYAFINALTKGYYSVMIAIIAIGIILVFGFFFMLA